MIDQTQELRQLILSVHLMDEDKVISSWEKSSKITIENRISAQKRAKNLIKDIPLRRLGLPQEVANTIFFLCSETSSYISGEELQVNGGQHV